MQEERRLQRLGQNVEPEDGLVQPVPLARTVQLSGKLQRVKRERNQAEQVEMRRTGRGPAAKQDVEADGQVDQSNNSQRLRYAPVQRFGNDEHGRFERNAVSGDRIQ